MLYKLLPGADVLWDRKTGDLENIFGMTNPTGKNESRTLTPVQYKVIIPGHGSPHG